MQCGHGATDGHRAAAQGSYAFRRCRFVCRGQALDVVLCNGSDVGDLRHIRHRERAIHGVQRAYQGFACIGGRRLYRCQPTIHGFQMCGDFGIQDFAQHAVDGRWRAFCFGLENKRRRFLQRIVGFIFTHGECGGRCRVEHFFTGSHAITEVLHAQQVRRDHALSAQRGIELWQYVRRLLQQRDDRG